MRALVRDLNWMDLCPLLPTIADPPVIDFFFFFGARKDLVPWSDWQFLLTPTHFFTSAGDDTSSCDWGTDESKLVSALQGAICGWRNPGWDWWVCVPAPMLLCKDSQIFISSELSKDCSLVWGGVFDNKHLGSGKILSGCYKIASQNSFFPKIFPVH